MPMTLAALLQQPALGLTALTGADALRREISWVHASELVDPTPYLDGGELLLSVGMWLDPVADRSAQRAQVVAYVDRLVDAGVVGLGFGVGLQHAEMPVGLVDAADARGLPLIQVPEHTAFVAIGRSVWEALAADQNAEMTRTSTAQQDLTRAAVAGGASGLIRRLAERLDGWALLLDVGGAVQHAAPTGADRRAAWLGTELERFRDLSSPVSATLSVENDQIAVQSLRLGRRTGGFLAVGSPQRLSREQRTVLNTAVSLLTLMLARPAPCGRRNRTCGRRSSSSWWAARSVGRRNSRVDCGGGCRPIRCGCCWWRGRRGAGMTSPRTSSAPPVPAGGAGSRPASGCSTRRSTTGWPWCIRLRPVAEPRAGRGGRTGRAHRRRIDRGDVHRHGRAHREAEQALAAGSGRIGPADVLHDIGASGLLGSLLAGPTATVFLKSMPRPLVEDDASGRGVLVRSLSTWLDHG